MHRALKNDAQAFDEIRIRTVIRWKESELSGDEHRISAAVDFLRHGEIVHTADYGRNIEAAIMGLGFLYHSAIDDGKGYFAGEKDWCDQTGCTNKATRAFKLIKGYNRDGNPRRLFSDGEYRLFCEAHKHRGDCALEDAAKNYIEIPLTPDLIR